MGFAATDNTAWKQIATEKAYAAKQFVRISLGLFVACNVLAATTIAAKSKYSSMCDFIQQQHELSDGTTDDAVTKALKTEFCE